MLSREAPQGDWPSSQLTCTWCFPSVSHEPPTILFSTLLPDAAPEPNNVQRTRQKLQNKTNIAWSFSKKYEYIYVSVNVVRKRKHTCKHQGQNKTGQHHNDCSHSAPVLSTICQPVSQIFISFTYHHKET